MNVKNLTILIVDDVSVVRQTLRNSIQQLGIEKILEASNINEAWQLINEYPIDIVFSDWNMPDGDGIDLLKKLRASEDVKLKYQKFIMITGAKEKSFEAMDAGAHNIIHKPFKSDGILKKIELIYN